MVKHFVFRSLDVSRAVEEESAHVGARSRDANGNVLLDSLVLDEEYVVLFRRLFLEARAVVLGRFLDFLVDENIPCFDESDFSDSEDFEFSLRLPNDAVAMVVDARVMEFLVTRVLYRWFETKLPELAPVYAARAGASLDTAISALRSRRQATIIPGWIA